MNYRKLSIVLFHYLYLYKNKNRKADLSPFNYARWPHKIRIRNTPHLVHANIERNLHKKLKPNKVS